MMLTRPFWLILGCVSLILAAIGAVLPLLPTTPLVILSAFAFSKSSPRLQAKLENSRLFGPAIADWRRHGAIAPRAKRLAVAMMALVFAISLVLGVGTVVLIVQALCLGGAAAFVLTRPDGP